MKKGKWKKLCSMILAVIMMVTLAACANTDTKNNNQKENVNNQLAKQNVFAYEDLDFEEFGDNVSIRKVSYSDGRIYALLDIYVENTPSMGARARIAAAAGDIMVDDDMAVDPGFGVEMPEEYVEPTHIVRVLSFLPDGSDRQYFDLDLVQEDGQEIYINNVSFGTDRLYTTNYRSSWDETDPENPQYTEIWELACWDNTGVMLWKTELNDHLAEEGEYFYISNIFAGSDGSVHATTEGNEVKIASVDKDGNLLQIEKLNLPDSEYVYNMFMNQEDKLTVIYVNADWTKFFATTYDPATGTIGEKTELPDNLMQYSIYPGGGSLDLVLTTSTGIYTYNIGDSEVKKLMDYVNSDLESGYLNHITVIDEECFLAAYSDPIEYQQRLAVFTKVAEEDIPDKTVLVLGTQYLDYDVRKRVIDFNKTNANYRITIKEYNTYATADDYMAGYTQLNNDIIAGDMPDILVADSSIPVDNYISKGLLADIGKMIEEDEELSQTAFMKNVFEAYSVDGVLYHVIPQFNVRTLIGKTAHLGDRAGWNMEEFQQVAAQLPEGSSMFGDMTQQAFIYQILQYCGTDFIHPDTGSCNFDSQEFINILEYAKSLPTEIMYEEDYDWSLYETQYREDRTILTMLYINNFSNLIYNIKGQFGEEVTFIGFPNENRNGSVISANSSFVLSKKSNALEGAWEFVRYYLTDEYQETLEYGLPVNKDAFMKQARKSMEKPYYEDENGNKIEYDYTYWMNNEEIIIPPFTQEEVDKMVSFVESVNRCAFFNEEVSNIIAEEAGPFYEGQKSAKEAADIIQNRINLYMMENK